MGTLKETLKTITCTYMKLVAALLQPHIYKVSKEIVHEIKFKDIAVMQI